MQADPRLVPSTLHSCSHPTRPRPVPWGPVVVAGALVAEPVPEFQSAGVVHAQPHMGSVGHLGSLTDPLLFSSAVDGDKVVMFLPAVIHGVEPGLILTFD